MANAVHLQVLQEGVDAWNKWRKEKPDIQPDLAGADLAGVDLAGADLTGTDLRGAVLGGADLTRAILAAAVFGTVAAEGTVPPVEVVKKRLVHGARLWNADLQDTALTEVDGLFAGQLGATNLHATRLPDDIKELKGVDQVEELSKNAGELFLAMLGACAYCGLTLYSTKDVQLLTDSLGTKLPIIETEVPIVRFYLAAPVVVLGLYLYHHLYLRRLWEALAELPAIFPDGKTVDERTYPWLLNGLVYVYFHHLHELRPALWRLQQWLSILTAWCTVPLTLFLFLGRHLRCHQWGQTYFLIGLLAVSVWAGVEFYRLAATTLRHGKTRPRAEKRFGPFVKRQWPALIAILSGLLFANLSDNAIKGVPPGHDTSPGDKAAPLLRRWVPCALKAIGCNPFADFRDADVSTKPATWTGITADARKQSEQIALVKGAQLHDAHLQRLYADGAFLVKADLTRADLTGADLTRADLRGAKYFRADFTGARYDPGTHWPDGFKLKQQGVVLVKPESPESP